MVHSAAAMALERDMSCARGNLTSFVTVHQGAPKAGLKTYGGKAGLKAEIWPSRMTKHLYFSF